MQQTQRVSNQIHRQTVARPIERNEQATTALAPSLGQAGGGTADQDNPKHMWFQHTNIRTSHLWVYLILQGCEVRAQDANLLSRSGAQERRHDPKGQAKPRRSVHNERLVAAFHVVQASKLRHRLDVLLDFPRQCLKGSASKIAKYMDEKKKQGLVYEDEVQASERA